MDKKLKPCPFCGGKVKVENIALEIGDKYYMVQCENENECGAGCTFGEGTKKEIIERWNRRVNNG